MAFFIYVIMAINPILAKIKTEIVGNTDVDSSSGPRGFAYFPLEDNFDCISRAIVAKVT